MTATSNQYLLTAPDLIHLFVEEGLTTVEEMEEANVAYNEWFAELEKEWPPERVKEAVLSLMRERYQKTALYIKKLELDNRDARVRGVSYKERQKNHHRIEVGTRVLKEYAEEGKAAAKVTFTVKDMVTPLDMDQVQKEGFEKYLYKTYLFGLSTGAFPNA
jgi:hypothetical protein